MAALPKSANGLVTVTITLTRQEAMAIAYALECSSEELRAAHWRWRSKLHGRVSGEFDSAATANVDPKDLPRLKRLARQRPTELRRPKAA